MVQYPPNYKEQETYYASQEYKDGVAEALEKDNKLPTFETRDRKVTSRNRNKKLPPLSYPLATGPSQRTGDRLVIKCLKFEPPEDGAGAKVTPTNLFKETFKDGKSQGVSVITSKDMAAIRNNEMKIPDGNGGFMTGNEKVGITFEVTDANSRLSAESNRLLKYIIELPIPQDLTDSNSVTWGEDRANALELGALAAAQQAMGGNIGEGIVQSGQTAVRE